MDDETPQINLQEDDQQRTTSPAQASSGQATAAGGASGSNLAADYAAAQEIHENEQVSIQTPEEGLEGTETEQRTENEEDDIAEQILNIEEDDAAAVEDDDTELPEEEGEQPAQEQTTTEDDREDQDDDDDDAADDEVGKAAPEDEDAEDQTRNDTEPEASPDQPADTLQPAPGVEVQVATPGSVVSPTAVPEGAQPQAAADVPAEGGGIITGQFDPATTQAVESVNNETTPDEGVDDPSTSDETGDTTADPADEVLTPNTDTTNVENIINDAFGEEFTGGQGDVGGFIGEGGDEA